MRKEKNFKVTLTTLEPFRIGGKQDPLTGAENPVVTIGGRVAIPGPSLKGAYRNALERYFQEKYWDEKSGWGKDNLECQPCVPGTTLSADEETLVEKGLYSGPSCHYPCDLTHGRHTGKCGEMPHSICPVCYMLGAQGLVGFVRVPFLFADISSDELYSARIDRATGVVAKGTNRPYQIVPDNTNFEGVLSVILKDEFLGWELGKPRPLTDQTKGDAWLQRETEWTAESILNELIVNLIKSINILGGYKSKGCGKVEIDIKEI
jgi:CRISPR/Cas system CSM-associated protein Csm3 (group 7 of RAMP superfamily)